MALVRHYIQIISWRYDMNTVNTYTAYKIVVIRVGMCPQTSFCFFLILDGGTTDKPDQRT